MDWQTFFALLLRVDYQDAKAIPLPKILQEYLVHIGNVRTFSYRLLNTAVPTTGGYIRAGSYAITRKFNVVILRFIDLLLSH